MHEKYMGTLSSNDYALDNTTIDFTSTYRRVYFESPPQVAILATANQVGFLVYHDTTNTTFLEITCTYINSLVILIEATPVCSQKHKMMQTTELGTLGTTSGPPPESDIHN